MAQTNFTPILLYSSSTPTNAPSAGNLTNSTNGSEIAINIADKNLFFKDSGGTVNTVPIRQSSASSNGWLSSTDWNTFNNKSNTNGTVTSVAALTLGTTGTDLSSTVANGTTTPVITLNVPTASAANRGALSAADWSTFNGKQAALISGTNIKTVGGVTLLGSGDVGTIGVGYGGTGLTSLTASYIPYGNGTSAFSSSSTLTYNGTALTAGNFVPGSSTVPTNGMYLPAANAVGIATNSTNRIYITSGGLIGFNTSTPSEALTIQNGGYPLVGFYDGATARGVIGYVFDWGTFAVQSQASLAFRTGASEKMRIASSGGVSIGNTTDPGAGSLYVNNILYLSNTTGLQPANGGISLIPNAGGNQGIIDIGHATGVPSGYRWMGFCYNGTVIGEITQNGTTATTYATSSDYRLKENIAPMQNALNVVRQLKPVTYTWKADGSEGQGFIAHELQEVVPDCVIGEKDGVDEKGNPKYQGIDTSFLVATLTAAIQELNEKFDAYVASHP